MTHDLSPRHRVACTIDAAFNQLRADQKAHPARWDRQAREEANLRIKVIQSLFDSGQLDAAAKACGSLM